MRYICLAVVTIVSCQKERVFNNRLDPECEDKKVRCTALSQGGAEGGIEGTEENAQGVDVDYAGESPASNLALLDPIEFAPEGCKNIKDITLFDQVNTIRVFYRASCGQRTMLYTQSLTFERQLQDDRKEVSTRCDVGAYGVGKFTVDQGAEGYLVSYVCEPISGTYQSSLASVDRAGDVTWAKVLDEGLNSDYHVSWNYVAKKYAVVRAGSFKIVDQEGNLHPIRYTFNGKAILSLSSFEGNWLLVGRNEDLHFATIRSNGEKVCEIRHPSLRDIQALSVTGPNVAYGQYSDSAIVRFAVPLDSCYLRDQRKADPQNLHKRASETLKLGTINDSVGYALFRNKDLLVAATFSATNDFQLFKEKAYATRNESGSPDLRIINKRIYLTYDFDGKGYLYMSGETLQ